MNEVTVSNLSADDVEFMELGYSLGQNQTFGVLSGRCSAAQAPVIRSLREQKLHKR